jgi:hypothetical protein
MQPLQNPPSCSSTVSLHFGTIGCREQDRLKKEMMERVENVAAEFRKVAHSQMAVTTQRTIRQTEQSILIEN